MTPTCISQDGASSLEDEAAESHLEVEACSFEDGAYRFRSPHCPDAVFPYFTGEQEGMHQLKIFGRLPELASAQFILGIGVAVAG